MSDGSAPVEPSREGEARSAFTPILERLAHSCRGGIAAVLVDEEGENVDYATRVTSLGEQVEPYQVKLAGAHWQIVMRALCAQRLLSPKSLCVDAEKYSFLLHVLHGGYVLVLVLRSEAVWSVSARALRQAEVELCFEAGWPMPSPERAAWRRVRVERDRHGALEAVRMAGKWFRDFSILGPAPDLEPPERGLRVRLGPYADLTLVRDASGAWYLGGCRPAELYRLGAPTDGRNDVKA